MAIILNIKQKYHIFVKNVILKMSTHQTISPSTLKLIKCTQSTKRGC